MSKYITRKKTLMGKRYEVEVPLAQYGGGYRQDSCSPWSGAGPVEDRTGYKIEDALAALSSQNLTEEEIRALKENAAGPEPKAKVPKALSPKLVLFLGEIIRRPWSRIRTAPARAKAAMSAMYSR